MRIGFSLLPDEAGHRNCALTLARRLAEQGHEIVFAGTADDEEAFSATEFDYYALAEDEWPAGKVRRFKESRTMSPLKLRAHFAEFRSLLGAIASEEELARSFDIVICDSIAPYAALLAVKAGVPCVMLCTTLSDANPSIPSMFSSDVPRPDGSLSWKSKLKKRYGPFTLRTLAERSVMKFVVPERQMLETFGLDDEYDTIFDFIHHQPRLIACPRAFDFPVAPLSDEFHIDPLVDTGRTEESFDWDAIDTDRTLLYASMGSQTWMMKNPERFYRTLVETVGARDDVTMLLSAGDFADRPPLAGELPDNVVVRRWVPQMAVLQRARVMLTHAGLNSVKECIWNGVSMLAFPVGRDQPGNAARVEYHRLGLRGDHRRVTVRALHDMLDDLTTDPAYQRSVDQMRNAFHEATDRNEAVRIVELLAKK